MLDAFITNTLLFVNACLLAQTVSYVIVAFAFSCLVTHYIITHPKGD